MCDRYIQGAAVQHTKVKQNKNHPHPEEKITPEQVTHNKTTRAMYTHYDNDLLAQQLTAAYTTRHNPLDVLGNYSSSFFSSSMVYSGATTTTRPSPSQAPINDPHTPNPLHANWSPHLQKSYYGTPQNCILPSQPWDTPTHKKRQDRWPCKYSTTMTRQALAIIVTAT